MRKGVISHLSAAHSRQVNGVVSGRYPLESADPRIVDSWRRCLTDYQLDPAQTAKPSILPQVRLKERREQARDLLCIARGEMAFLSRLLNAPVGVMLTDTDGVILEYSGSADFASTAEMSALREGAVWSEVKQGTNGMGTCLATRAPIIVQQRDHFLFGNTALTCCAGPIWDDRGNLIAALNISGCLQFSAATTLALVRMAVQNIENRTLLRSHRTDYVLRFHPHAEWISTSGEGLVAVNEAGRIAGFNQSALEWLGIEDSQQLYGQTIERAVGLELSQLERLSEVPAEAQPLPIRPRTPLNFAVVQPPSGRRAGPSTLASAEREALREALSAHGWNVSAAARELGLSRRTLHRKLKLHALQRYRAQ